MRSLIRAVHRCTQGGDEGPRACVLRVVLRACLRACRGHACRTHERGGGGTSQGSYASRSPSMMCLYTTCHAGSSQLHVSTLWSTLPPTLPRAQTGSGFVRIGVTSNRLRAGRWALPMRTGGLALRRMAVPLHSTASPWDSDHTHACCDWPCERAALEGPARYSGSTLLPLINRVRKGTPGSTLRYRASEPLSMWSFRPVCFS
jgi:hypothetical protein